MKFAFFNRLRDFVSEQEVERMKIRILAEYQKGKRLDEIIPKGLREDCVGELTKVVEARNYSREQLLRFMERRRNWLYKRRVCEKPIFEKPDTGDELTNIMLEGSFQESVREITGKYDVVHCALYNVYEKVRDWEQRLAECKRIQAVNRWSEENDRLNRIALQEEDASGRRYVG